LRLDEAALVLEIMRRSIADMFFGIGYNSDVATTAPNGFLIAEKILIQQFGNSEMILRVVPLIGAIAALFLFYKLIKHFLAPEVHSIALGIFVLSEPLIFYSADVKPYSCDVLATIVLILLFEFIAKNKFTNIKAIWVGVLGAITMWFSFTSIFVLAAVGIVGLGFGIGRKCTDRVLFILIGAIFWILNFVGLYFNGLQQIKGNSDLGRMWDMAFMPWPIGSLDSFIWLKQSFLEIFSSTLGLSVTIFAFSLFAVGCFSLCQREKEKFALLISPIIIVLSFSILHLYPFS